MKSRGTSTPPGALTRLRGARSTVCGRRVALPSLVALAALTSQVALAAPAAVPVAAAPVGGTTRAYRLEPTAESGYRLQPGSVPLRTPGAREVLIRVRASSLNRRDLSILQRRYGGDDHAGRIPLSDGAGEVLAVGAGASKWRPGDRVMANFFPDWTGGKPTEANVRSALGGELDGMLAEQVVLHEDALVRIPAHLSFEQAATLPCAGLTAWNGLMRAGPIGPADTVLVQGTGGVSIFGLQIARAAGSRVAITSSSDAKLARAKTLGATILVNYRTTPEWQRAVLEQTGGRGVDRVLEVGGKDTLPRAVEVLAYGGNLALIGGLSGFGGEIPGVALLGRSATASGIYVGSRAEFEQFAAFVERHRLVPVIDRTFPFEHAAEAYALMASGEHFGKIVIRH
jgi:NADPH:quinone reductase-like Zn-dependent oxidoreductase